MLVVLDDAASVEQVSPLLPGSPGCLVVITSRNPLVGLTARYGARLLDLAPLPERDAAELLVGLIDDRAASDPDGVASLALACARVPLALRFAGEMAARQPTATLRDLITDITDAQRVLGPGAAGMNR